MVGGDACTPVEVRQFPLVVVEHLPSLRRFAATLVARDDVDDCVQAALTRAWTKWDQQDPARGSVKGWLFAIVRDQARQHHARRGRSWTLDLAEESTLVPSAVVRGAVAAEPDGTSTDLRRAINELPERQRTATVLYHYVDLPIAEIATLMGCSSGTVKSTLHDARRSLADRLGADYDQN